ncbi:MAG: L-histidine N(alpha)-methyltransferase [Planctomycetota bacterium]
MPEATQLQKTEADSQFLEDVLEGLDAVPKSLPCKYFYDARGSALFDRICELDEYYLTRTEQKIMDRYAAEIGIALGRGVTLVEYGSGSSTKTRRLLSNLIEPTSYIPIDISHDHLHATAKGLRQEFPSLTILPTTADFTQSVRLPELDPLPSSIAVYFPGSTIGNFERDQAVALLRRMALTCGDGGSLIIGVDLVKDAKVLESAYDDRGGVTAAFNLNLLHRLRNELNARLSVEDFEHVALFDPEFSRIEIYIRSLCEQTIALGDRVFRLGEGELIHTEYSHKYTIDSFTKLAGEAGFLLEHLWTDPEDLFAVLHLRQHAY